MTLSIGKAWEETSAFLRREGRLVAPVALATFALPTVLTHWAYPGGRSGGGGALLVIMMLMAAVLGQMTIVLLATGWRASIGEAMTKALRRLPTLIGALLLVFVPVLLMMAIALGASLAGAGITDPADLTPNSLARVPNVRWVVLMLSLLFIFAAVRLFPVSAVAASEAVGPIGLLKRSWTLTRAAFWRLLVLVLLLGLVTVVLDSAVTMVIGSLATLTAGEPRAFNLSALIVALARGLVGAAISSVSAAMVGRVYAQLSAAPDVSKS